MTNCKGVPRPASVTASCNGLLKLDLQTGCLPRLQVAATQLRSILQIGLRWPPLEGAELLRTSFGQQRPAALATLQVSTCSHVTGTSTSGCMQASHGSQAGLCLPQPRPPPPPPTPAAPPLIFPA